MKNSSYSSEYRGRSDPLRPGDTAYLVHSKLFVRKVTVLSNDAYGMYSVRFSDSGGGIRVRRNRLYLSKEAAERHLRSNAVESHISTLD